MSQPTNPNHRLPITLTSAGLTACRQFIAAQGAAPLNDEQIEATVATSLATLLDLFNEEKWLQCVGAHHFKAMGTFISAQYHALTLHARPQDDESWLVGTADEFPVSAEYLRRRRESEAAIVRALQ